MNQNDEEPRSKSRKKAKSRSTKPKARRSANKARKKAKSAAASNGSQDAIPQPVLEATVEEPAASGNDGPETSGVGGIAKVSDLLNVPSFRKMVIDRLVKKLG